MALSSPVLLVALRAPSQSEPEGDVDTGPHIARVSAPPGKVMWTPQPADPVGRAEPSVKRKATGSSNRGFPGPVDFAMYFSAFVVESLFTSAGIPTV